MTTDKSAGPFEDGREGYDFQEAEGSADSAEETEAQEVPQSAEGASCQDSGDDEGAAPKVLRALLEDLQDICPAPILDDTLYFHQAFAPRVVADDGDGGDASATESVGTSGLSPDIEELRVLLESLSGEKMSDITDLSEEQLVALLEKASSIPLFDCAPDLSEIPPSAASRSRPTTQQSAAFATPENQKPQSPRFAEHAFNMLSAYLRPRWHVASGQFGNVRIDRVLVVRVHSKRVPVIPGVKVYEPDMGISSIRVQAALAADARRVAHSGSILDAVNLLKKAYAFATNYQSTATPATPPYSF